MICVKRSSWVAREKMRSYSVNESVYRIITLEQTRLMEKYADVSVSRFVLRYYARADYLVSKPFLISKVYFNNSVY